MLLVAHYYNTHIFFSQGFILIFHMNNLILLAIVYKDFAKIEMRIFLIALVSIFPLPSTIIEISPFSSVRYILAPQIC